MPQFGKRGGPKKSLCWIEGYERIAEKAVNLPTTRLVYVADREADLMPCWCAPRITAAALFMVAALRIAHLMRLGRTCPDLDAALFFEPDEIRGAYLLK